MRIMGALLLTEIKISMNDKNVVETVPLKYIHMLGMCLHKIHLTLRKFEKDVKRKGRFSYPIIRMFCYLPSAIDHLIDWTLSKRKYRR